MMIRFFILLLIIQISGCNPFQQKDSQILLDDGSLISSPIDDVAVQDKPIPEPAVVSGFVRYQDRVYNQNGFIYNNQPYKAVRNVTVQLLALNEALSRVVIDETTTSETGFYQFDNALTGELTIRILAESQAVNGEWIRIMNDSADLYAIDQDITVIDTIETFDVDLTIADRVSGIFNMIDVFQSAFEFVGDVSASSRFLDDLNVFWHWGISEGSYTCRTSGGSCANGPGIYVLSDPMSSGDTDEFDDDVLLHEFAHYLESSLLMWDSPGGAHSLTNRYLDIRLSWSEGMASFFATSVKQWLKLNAPQRLSIPNSVGTDLSTYYIDTRGNSVSVSIDLENASTSMYAYATNEVAVAASLIGLQNHLGFNIIWQSFFDYLTINQTSAVTADTLESFWDGLIGFNSFLLREGSAELATMQNELTQRSIDYKMDTFESNNILTSGTDINAVINQTLSLYKSTSSTDTDWFYIDVEASKNYQIETLNLRNGADTLMELFDSASSAVLDINGNPLLNDDAFDCELLAGGCSPLHDGANFSSKISFSAAATERLYVKVTTSSYVFEDPISYGYIGRYGSYQISFSEIP